MQTSPEKVAAVEEAGHAIVAVHLGGKVNWITISGKDIPEGILPKGIHAVMNYDLDPSNPDDDLVVGVAGRTAREIIFGGYQFGTFSTDEVIIMDCLRERFLNEGVPEKDVAIKASKYMEHVLIPKAKDILSEPRARKALDELIEILLERETLIDDADQITHLLLGLPPIC